MRRGSLVNIENNDLRKDSKVGKKKERHQKECVVNEKNGRHNEKRDPVDRTSLVPVFSIVVLLFTLSTVWALWDEVYGRRPWKNFQSEFLEIAEKKLESDLTANLTELEQSQEYQELKNRLYQAKKTYEEAPERHKLLDQIMATDVQLGILRKSYIIDRGEYQATIYKMERTSGEDERSKLLIDVKETEVILGKIREEMTVLNEHKKKLQESLAEIESDRKNLSIQLARFERPLSTLELKLEGIRSEKIEIKQLFNQELSLIDRCESCHLAATKKGFPNFKDPFRTHSDVVSLPSPDPEIEALRNLLDIHPIEKYGCTTCHHGQGYATTSVEKAHGEVEYWSTPLLRGDTIQASCSKCHFREPQLYGADLLNEGRRLFSDLGCVWCHETLLITPEEKRGKNVFDLTQVTLKLNFGWMIEWIEDPKGFRPETLMPDFYFNKSEAIAIASYLWRNSETTETLIEDSPFAEESISLGKTLFESRSCFACHRVSDNGNTYAANLSRVGEKTSYKYLANWIINPRKWQPDGEMPIVVFDPEESFKIAAYLSTLREGSVSKVKPTSGDFELLDKGKNLIVRYECYRCHNILGLDDATSAVPDLPNIGSKPIGEFDFGLLEDEILNAGGMRDPFENVSRTRELWLRYKLKEPRGFDKGKYKKPEEGLRMPNFSLTPEQINVLTVFLLGMTSESPPSSYQYTPTPIERTIASGRIYFRIYRCFACHGDEGSGGIINPNYTKDTIPSLNILAEKLHLEELEDVENIIQILIKGIDLRSIISSRIPRFPVVKGQYKALLELISEGQLIKKKDPEGQEPPFHMPSWKGTLQSGQINDIIIYLLSQYPWDEDEWDEDEWDEDEEQ
jgi:mono/diheme cytochrome c family protein